MSPKSAMEHCFAVLPFRDVFNAVALDSRESNRPAFMFEGVFLRARADGLKLTAHYDFDQNDTHEHIREGRYHDGRIRR